jgi:hypothetical protein
MGRIMNVDDAMTARAPLDPVGLVAFAATQPPVVSTTCSTRPAEANKRRRRRLDICARCPKPRSMQSVARQPAERSSFAQLPRRGANPGTAEWAGLVGTMPDRKGFRRPRTYWNTA